MSYRPICDVWILARSKVPYYGAYPAGFLERARALLGVGYGDAVLHVCAGLVRRYPYPRFALGDRDVTLDVNQALAPDIVCDVTAGSLPPPPWPSSPAWDAMLADRPYTEVDALKYGRAPLPSAGPLLREMLARTKAGGRVGMLDYELPRPPKGTRFVACVGVVVGFGNRVRIFSVYENPR